MLLDQPFEYLLQFTDGTYHTGFAATMDELALTRTGNVRDALAYTLRGAYKIQDAFPAAELQVVHI